MLTQTTEIRWFWHAIEPVNKQHWFFGQNQLQLEQRTDRYLLLPGCRTTGVKLREGRLEVKVLQEEAAPADIAGTWHGSLQSWLKWSAESPQLFPQGYTDEHWLLINKRRFQRRLSFKEGQLIELRAEAPPANPEYSAELTDISIEGRNDQWQTFGLETNAPMALAEKPLRTILLDCFCPNEAPATKTRTLAAMSYPAWLTENFGR